MSTFTKIKGKLLLKIIVAWDFRPHLFSGIGKMYFYRIQFRIWEIFELEHDSVVWKRIRMLLDILVRWHQRCLKQCWFKPGSMKAYCPFKIDNIQRRCILCTIKLKLKIKLLKAKNDCNLTRSYICISAVSDNVDSPFFFINPRNLNRIQKKIKVWFRVRWGRFIKSQLKTSCHYSFNL